MSLTNTYACLNHESKRVTGLYLANSAMDAARFLMDPGTDRREIRELPESSKGWSLASATHFFFPETIVTLGGSPR